MLAVSCFFSHATAGLTIQLVHLLKVSCIFFARLRPSCALDPHVSDHVVVTKVASHMLLNRSIKYKQYSSNAVKSVIRNAEGPLRLAKLVSVSVQVLSPSISFTLTSRHPISSTDQVLIAQPLISILQATAAYYSSCRSNGRTEGRMVDLGWAIPIGIQPPRSTHGNQ